jgi:antitoxin (DNA-binding transcriptional repressor) of toxin-antitoxin stability system
MPANQTATPKSAGSKALSQKPSESPTINIYAAKTQLSKLVDLASAGTDVIIARAGKPVARLTMLNAPKKKKYTLGLLEGKGWIADDFDAPLPDDLLALFEGRNEPEW